MGTNYYLKKKVNYEPNLKVCVGCEPYEHELRELENGFVFDNVYYPNETELNEKLYQLIHIGKSSCGWHFLLCVYPDLNINNLSDWEKLFESNLIENEYGETITPQEMLETIIDRKHIGYDSNKIVEFEKEQVEQNKEFEQKFPSRFRPIPETYDQLLEQNSAERGLNGLWAHKYHTKRTSGTYDLINGNEHIFS